MRPLRLHIEKEERSVGMKVGRRAFLQFTAGVVGGTLFTPLPWKLAADSAKWTQNWPWEPSPERGEITSVSTTCPFCDGGCGVNVRLVDGRRAILIEGNPKHPVNRGGVCALAASGLQRLYAPYRLKGPMKQTKKRGDVDGFQPISWTDAIAELAKAMGDLRGQGHPEGLACITGAPHNSMYALWQRFFATYGSPNLFSMPSELDGQKLAAYSVFGKAAPVSFALERASYVLSFGADLLEGWGTFGRIQTAYGMWQEKARKGEPVRLVQVDPRCSLTASKADDWVAVKPGSESALALGIAHVLIREGLYDADLASRTFFGFEDWTDAQGKERKGFKNFVTAAYSPERVSEITGVNPDKIVEIAKDFGGRKNALAIWGSCNGGVANPYHQEVAFIALNALVGNLKPGGMLGITPDPPLGALPDPQVDAVAVEGLKRPRLDMAGSAMPPLPGNALHGFLDGAAKGGGYSIGVLLVHEANPFYSLAENNLYRAAIEKVGLVASFSSYMDETAVHADLILPNHAALERYDDYTCLAGAPYGYYAITSPVLPPHKDTKHTGEVIFDLTKGMESLKDSFPWKSYEDYLKDRVKGLAASGRGAVADKGDETPWSWMPGKGPEVNYKDDADLWKKLAKGGMCWCDAQESLLEDLSTQSGDCELASQVLLGRGLKTDKDEAYLPRYAPLALGGSEQDLPLLLLAYRLPNIASGFLPNSPFLNKTIPDSLLLHDDQFVDVHPKTAKSLGLAEGDRAAIKTLQGEAVVRVHVHPGAQPGVAFMAQGLGHAAYDEYIDGKGANVNTLMEVLTDPVTGLGVAWAARAQLRRV